MLLLIHQHLLHAGIEAWHGLRERPRHVRLPRLACIVCLGCARHGLLLGHLLRLMGRLLRLLLLNTLGKHRQQRVSNFS